MRTPIRSLAWVTLPLLLSGCAAMTPLQSTDADVQQTERQLQSLTQRVEQLETQRGIVPTSSTFLSPGSDQDPMSPPPDGGGGFQSRSAFSKLGRGVTNVLTGWVEIPKRIIETSQQSGPWTGWTWGLMRGIGHGFIRTAAGLYETVSFPVPAPADYQPILQPEYVFTGGI